MLEVEGVRKEFGGLVAVDDVDFSIGDDEIVGLIGPNGAGKTTLFNIITGMLRPEAGSVRLHGVELVGREPHEICRQGIGRTFQQVRTFNESSVLDNVYNGAIFGRGKGVPEEEVYEYLDFVGIADKADTAAKHLTIADRKLVELARALAGDPDYLLLDEIISGLNPAESAEVSDCIQRARTEYGVSVFWVEHIMDIIMNAADRIIVLKSGAKIAEGEPEQVQNMQNVLEAYLGESYA